MVALGRFRAEVEEGERRIASIPRCNAQTSAGQTEYADEGAGTPVLASHGVCASGFVGGLWTGRHVLGEGGFLFIAPSRFGYLGTPMPVAATAESQADAYAALLDHLGIDRVIVVGFSAGATSAIQFALRHPDRTTALISVSSNVPGPHLEKVQRIPRSLRSAFGTDVVWWVFRQYFFERYLHFIGVPTGWHYSDDDRAALNEIVPGLFPIHDRAAGVIFDTFESNPSINQPFTRELHVPALIVHALDDPLAPYEGARRLVDRLAGARLVTLERGGHLQLGGAVADLRSSVNGFLVQLGMPQEAADSDPAKGRLGSRHASLIGKGGE
jgi:pimeloyl-ACP methyl ester carboxylesterase